MRLTTAVLLLGATGPVAGVKLEGKNGGFLDSESWNNWGKRAWEAVTSWRPGTVLGALARNASGLLSAEGSAKGKEGSLGSLRGGGQTRRVPEILQTAWSGVKQFVAPEPVNLDELIIIANLDADSSDPDEDLESALDIATDLRNHNHFVMKTGRLRVAADALNRIITDGEEIGQLKSTLLNVDVEGTGKKLADHATDPRRTLDPFTWFPATTKSYIPKLLEVSVKTQDGKDEKILKVDREGFIMGFNPQDRPTIRAQLKGKASSDAPLIIGKYRVFWKAFEGFYLDLNDQPEFPETLDGRANTSMETLAGLIGKIKTMLSAPGTAQRKLGDLQLLLDVATDLYLHNKFVMDTDRLRAAANAILNMPNQNEKLNKAKQDLLRADVVGAGKQLGRFANPGQHGKDMKYIPKILRVRPILSSSQNNFLAPARCFSIRLDPSFFDRNVEALSQEVKKHLSEWDKVDSFAMGQKTFDLSDKRLVREILAENGAGEIIANIS